MVNCTHSPPYLTSLFETLEYVSVSGNKKVTNNVVKNFFNIEVKRK